jgi:hypothetical protein
MLFLLASELQINVVMCQLVNYFRNKKEPRGLNLWVLFYPLFHPDILTVIGNLYIADPVICPSKGTLFPL